MQLLPAYIDVSQFNPPPKKYNNYWLLQETTAEQMVQDFSFFYSFDWLYICDNQSVTAIHMGRGPVLIDCRDFYLLH